jgi:photosystem II stability/assembly factor-like uncharacterized protein
MNKPILLILLLIIFISCKKKDDEDVVREPWKAVLSANDGWFGDTEITGKNVYVLWGNENASGTGASMRVYKSLNGGLDFALLPYDPDLYFSSIAFLDKSIGFMSGYRLIAKTTDAGQTWDTTGMGLINFDSFYILNSTVIGYGTGIYISNDTGSTWQQVQPSVMLYTSMDFVDDQMGFCADAGGSFYKTENAGMNWQKVTQLIDTEFIQIKFNDTENGIALILVIDSPHLDPGTQLLQTQDGGITWTPIEVESHGIVLGPSSCFESRSKDEIYLGAINGIFYSNDMGNNWATQYSEGTNIWVHDINFTNDIGIATTMWKKILKYVQ